MYGKNILIYDQKGYFGQGEEITSLLKIIKKVTNNTTSPISDTQYKSGMIKGFDKVFYVKFGNENIPRTLYKDLTHADKNMCLLGNGMDKITLGVISYKGKSSDIVKMIRYNKEQGIMPTVPINVIKINNPKVQIITKMSDGNSIYPFSIKYNKMLYFSSYYNDADLNNVIYKDMKQFYKTASLKVTPKVYNAPNTQSTTVNFSKPINMLIVLVAAICISFLVIFLISSRSSKKKLFKGR
jgi:hypothetical protein